MICRAQKSQLIPGEGYVTFCLVFGGKQSRARGRHNGTQPPMRGVSSGKGHTSEKHCGCVTACDEVFSRKSLPPRHAPAGLFSAVLNTGPLGGQKNEHRMAQHTDDDFMNAL